MSPGDYLSPGPSLEEVSKIAGPVLLQFGTDWCSYCARAEPLIRNALEEYPGTTHVKVEDGKGRRLGRAFKVKLWPTLIFLKDGTEQGRVVRPDTREEILTALRQLRDTA